MSSIDNTHSPTNDVGLPIDSTEVRLAHRRLELAVAIHEELVQRAIDGAGPGYLVRSLAQRIDKPVLLEDRFFHALSYAPPSNSTAMGRPAHPEPTAALLDDPGNRAAWNSLQATHQAIQLTAISGKGTAVGRAVAPIIVAGDLVAYLSIVGQDQPVTVEDLLVAREASLAIGVAFARQQVALETETRLKGDLLEALLVDDELSTEVLATRAALLAYDATASQTLLLLALDPSYGGVDRLARSDESQRRELLHSLVAWARRVAPGSLIAEKDGQIAVLMTGDHPLHGRGMSGFLHSRPSAASELASTLRRQVESVLVGRTVSIAVAPTVRDWHEVRNAYQVARRALQVLALLGEHGQTISTADPRLAVFLLFDSTTPEIRQEFVDLVLGPLIAYDQRGGRSLIPSLEAYLAHGGNLETTARALNVHTSTLKYRLQRIAEVGGLDVRNPDHRFNAALALRLRNLITSPLDGG